MKIFVGSSNEQKDLALDISAWIEESGCEPVAWMNVFRPGDVTINRLVELSKEVDAAVFISSPDDKIWYRHEQIAAPRDNIIFEYGLFLGVLGGASERRVIIVRVEKPKIATDLQGITFVAFAPDQKMVAERKIKDWAKSLKARPVTPALAGISRASRTKRELFEEGTKLVSKATSLVALCAKTPIAIAGPRPYGDNKKFKYELEQYNIYMAIAKKASEGKIDFVVAASIPCLRDLVTSLNSHDKAIVKNNISSMYDYAQKAGSRLNLLWYYGVAPVTFVVSDDDSIIWFKGSNQDNIWILDESDELAGALRAQFSTGWKQEPKEAVLKTLFE